MTLRNALLISIIPVLLLFCSCQGPANPHVQHFGTIHGMMMESDTSSKVLLEDVVPGPNTFGVGALPELRGEVTIMDDIVWRTYATDYGTRTDHNNPDKEGAALLVTTIVTEWQSLPVIHHVEFSQLDNWLAKQAQQNGIDPDQPFPFLIEGRFAELECHVIDGRKLKPGASHTEHRKSAIQLSLQDVVGILVGFRSISDQGIYTHRGEHLHIHAVIASENVTGHVDNVVIPAGSILKLPVR